MLRRIITTMALGMTLGISGVALAQSDNPNVNRPPQKPPADTPPNANKPPADRPHERSEADLPASFYRATELVGMRVDAKGGERIGDIRNLAINAETGRIRYVIIENGGTLYPIPAPAVNFAGNRQRATVDTTADRMKDAPTFKPDGWDTIGDATWGEKVFQFYGINRNADESKERPGFVPANAVVGAKAETRKGDNVGTIKDLMVDTDKDAIAYLAIESGGGNARLFAIPWQSANLNDNGKRVVVRGLERDDLRDAPGFPNNRWPAYRDLKWDNNTNFDSRPPHWVYGLNETGNGGGGGGGGGGNHNNDADRGAMGGWQTHGKYGELFKPNRVEKWSGSIVRTDSVTPMSGMDPGTALVVKTDKGNVVVHLGPEWFIRHQQDKFADGEEVNLTGSQVEIDGKQAIMATQVRLKDRTLYLRSADGVPIWDGWQERK